MQLQKNKLKTQDDAFNKYIQYMHTINTLKHFLLNHTETIKKKTYSAMLNEVYAVLNLN